MDDADFKNVLDSFENGPPRGSKTKLNRLDDALRGGQKMCSANVAAATVEAWIFQNVIFQHVTFLIGFEKHVKRPKLRPARRQQKKSKCCNCNGRGWDFSKCDFSKCVFWNLIFSKCI